MQPSALTFGGVAVYVDDVKAVLDFYRRAFGFETCFFDPEYDYGELDAGGPHLGIASHTLGRAVMPERYVPPARTGESFAFEIGFFTEDVAGAFARAVSAGAEAVAEPKTMPWGGTVAYVRSIEGTLVVICTRPKDNA
jgi:lactoylglutathione lyase